MLVLTAKEAIKLPVRPVLIKLQKALGAKFVSRRGNTPSGQDPEDGRILWKKVA